MIIAREKKEKNIVEYVLYMWQIEDIIRACNFEIKLLEKHIISQFEVDADTQLSIRDWYIDLIKQMKAEKLTETGHLDELNELVAELNFLHNTLIDITKDQKYVAAFNLAKPNIDALRKKTGGKNLTLIDLCLNGIYGLLVLRLKKKEISEETNQAVLTLSKLMSLLAAKYHELKS